MHLVFFAFEPSEEAADPLVGLIRFAIVCTTVAYAGILAAAECRCAVAGFRAAL